MTSVALISANVCKIRKFTEHLRTTPIFASGAVQKRVVIELKKMLRKMKLQLVKFGVDTAENGTLKIWVTCLTLPPRVEENTDGDRPQIGEVRAGLDPPVVEPGELRREQALRRGAAATWPSYLKFYGSFFQRRAYPPYSSKHLNTFVIVIF